MFAVPNATYAAWLTSQAKPCDLATHMPGNAHLHLRALNNALGWARSDILFVRYALATVEDDEWPAWEDTVAARLSSATLRLGGVLDGLLVLANMHADPSFEPTRYTSFCSAPFPRQDLVHIKDELMNLKSMDSPESPEYADFWTIANFWKHYFPYQPRPSDFVVPGTRDTVRDIQVQLGRCKSGPIMRDLIYPVFQGSVRLVHALDCLLGPPEPVPPPLIALVERLPSM